MFDYITIGVFDQLSEDDKLKVLMNNGRVISERKDNQTRSFLYYVGSFYVTVQYHIDTDEMTGISAFEKIGRKEKSEWKVLRALPGLLQASRKPDGLQ